MKNDEAAGQVTAGDEARDLRQGSRPKVMVTCNAPQGLVLNNHLAADGSVLMAPNMGPGTPIEVRGTMEVDAAFWNAWRKHNQGLIDQGLVSAVPIEEAREDERVDGEETLGNEGSGGPEQDLEQARQAKDA